MIYHIKKGTKSLLRQLEGCDCPFITRKALCFSANERIKSPPGKLAFSRKGYILTVEVNSVTLPVHVINAIKQCVFRLWEKVTTPEDRTRLMSLAQRQELSTAQAMLAAYLISKHRKFLPAYLWQEATKVFKKQVEYGKNSSFH